jgi:hypothetical protein
MGLLAPGVTRSVRGPGGTAPLESEQALLDLADLPGTVQAYVDHMRDLLAMGQVERVREAVLLIQRIEVRRDATPDQKRPGRDWLPRNLEALRLTTGKVKIVNSPGGIRTLVTLETPPQEIGYGPARASQRHAWVRDDCEVPAGFQQSGSGGIRPGVTTVTPPQMYRMQGRPLGQTEERRRAAGSWAIRCRCCWQVLRARLAAYGTGMSTPVVARHLRPEVGPLGSSTAVIPKESMGWVSKVSPIAGSWRDTGAPESD